MYTDDAFQAPLYSPVTICAVGGSRGTLPSPASPSTGLTLHMHFPRLPVLSLMCQQTWELSLLRKYKIQRAIAVDCTHPIPISYNKGSLNRDARAF